MLNTGPLNDSVYENGKWHVFLAISRALWIWICPVFLVDPGVVNCMHFQWAAWGFRITKWKQTVLSGQDTFKKMRYLWGQCAVCTGFAAPHSLYWWYMPGTWGGKNQQSPAVLHTGAAIPRAWMWMGSLRQEYIKAALEECLSLSRGAQEFHILTDEEKNPL